MEKSPQIKKIIEDIIVGACCAKHYHAHVASEAIFQALQEEGYYIVRKENLRFPSEKK